MLSSVRAAPAPTRRLAPATQRTAAQAPAPRQVATRALTVPTFATPEAG